MSETSQPEVPAGSNENVTNLGTPYTSPEYQFEDLPLFGNPPSFKAFSDSQKNIYSNHFTHMDQFESFPKLPNSDTPSSLEEYLLALRKWKDAAIEFSKTTTLPVPLGHAVSRPVPPEIIPKSQLSDMTTLRRLKRNFNPETSLPSPENQVALEKILNDGEPYDNDTLLPFLGLSEKEVPLRSQVYQTLPWSSILIPQKPEPYLYESFDDYEDALVRWGHQVVKTGFIPPSPDQIAENIPLVKEDKPGMTAAPPPPETLHEKPVPITTFKAGSHKTKHCIRKLQKKYSEFLESFVPTSKPVKISKLSAFNPPNAGNLSAASIIRSYIDNGTPLSVNNLSSPTQMRRYEMLASDIGWNAQTQFTDGASHKHFDAKEKYARDRDPLKLLLLDLNPRNFQKLLQDTVVVDEKYEPIGKVIASSLPLEEFVKHSYRTSSPRFLARCSILAHVYLTVDSVHNQVLQLELAALERFVELVVYTSPSSFSIMALPEEEISAAADVCNNNQQRFEEIVDSIKQAQILACLSDFSFSSPGTFFKFSKFIRTLVHQAFSRIADIVSNDVDFLGLIDGFSSDDPLVHNYYFRVLRTAILLQYSRVIRAFSTHDLISIFYKRLQSPNYLVNRHSQSLWQLFRHTGSAVVLRLQLLNTTPTVLSDILANSPPQVQELILGLFSLFKHSEKETEYRPFIFQNYHAFVHTCASNLKDPISVHLLYLLLSLSLSTSSIYCQNRADLKELINWLATSVAPELVYGEGFTGSVMAAKCVKVLFKNTNIEPASLSNAELWRALFLEMASKKDIYSNEYRMECWKIFRNTVLYQPTFMQFLFSSPELQKLFDNAFTSLDDRVRDCMISTLPRLARVAMKNFGLEEGIKSNLNDLFSRLSDPSVLISGKILSAYRLSKGATGMAKVRADLVEFIQILNETNTDPLKRFKDAPHIKEDLKSIFEEVQRLHSTG